MKKILFVLFLVFISVFSYSTEDLDQGIETVTIKEAKNFDKIKGQSRKETFIRTLVPIIEKIRTKVNNNRDKVYELSKKEILTEEEELFLDKMYSDYKVTTKTPENLIRKMVVPPTSLVLGQASLESGWGSSYLAKEGNNLFGMRSVTKNPDIAIQTGRSFWKRYATIKDSVEDYIMTLARHKTYAPLRGAINDGEGSIELVKHLSNYSEVKKTYAQRLVQLIKKNNLEDHDS